MVIGGAPFDNHSVSVVQIHPVPTVTGTIDRDLLIRFRGKSSRLDASEGEALSGSGSRITVLDGGGADRNSGAADSHRWGG